MRCTQSPHTTVQKKKERDETTLSLGFDMGTSQLKCLIPVSKGPILTNLLFSLGFQQLQKH